MKAAKNNNIPLVENTGGAACSEIMASLSPAKNASFIKSMAVGLFRGSGSSNRFAKSLAMAGSSDPAVRKKASKSPNSLVTSIPHSISIKTTPKHHISFFRP